MEANAWYIGCACDRKYVAPTATMLASIDINGNVPGANILVAGFGLTDEDAKILAAGAGALANKMFIHHVDAEQFGSINATRWTNEYPPAVIGRLFLADLIAQRGARLLTIDSDMIVNVSLRPLFEIDLFGSYVAACHDVPRHEDPDYFNSGIMLLDVDRYKQFNVAQRSLDWLAQQDNPVSFPDQDALNEVIGHIWYRLDHRWNFHCNYGEQRAVTSNDYERSYVAHFAARKPWDDPTHPGLPLYRHYKQELLRRIDFANMLADNADVAFVSAAHKIFLGRSPIDEVEYDKYTGLGARRIVTSIVKSDEFLLKVLAPLIMGGSIKSPRFEGQPDQLHRVWAISRLKLGDETKSHLRVSNDWIDFLSCILRDTSFRRWSSNERLMALADIIEGSLPARENSQSLLRSVIRKSR